MWGKFKDGAWITVAEAVLENKNKETHTKLAKTMDELLKKDGYDDVKFEGIEKNRNILLSHK